MSKKQNTVMKPVSTTYVTPVTNNGFSGLTSGFTPAQLSNAIEVTPKEDAPKKMDYLDMAAAYEAAARENFAQQQAALSSQLASSKQSTSSNYDSAAAGNYVNYMKQQNALGEQLAAQGIRGGASESALARIGNNYALNQGNTTAQRYGALSQLQNAYDTNIANMRANMENDILANRLAMQQAQFQYEDTLAQRAYEAQIRQEDIERAARERAEDIKRDTERYETEWDYKVVENKIEDYAAGLLDYNGTSGIAKLRKLMASIKENHPKWKSDHYYFGIIQAIKNRIGVIENTPK